jgi:hypothetical protein
VLIDVEDVALGHETNMRRNDRDNWVRSEQQTHEPPVAVGVFEAARLVFVVGAQRGHIRREKVTRGPLRAQRHGALRCLRPADAGLLEPRPAVLPLQVPRRVRRQRAAAHPAIDGWLAGLFDEDNVDHTCAALEATMGPDPAEEARLGARPPNRLRLD